MELNKLPFREIESVIALYPTTFLSSIETKVPKCNDYIKRFNATFSISRWDANFRQQFYIFLFSQYNSKRTKVSPLKLIDDFYDEYNKIWGNIPNRIEFKDIATVLHFIRKGNTPLYNDGYRKFFILNDFDSIIKNDENFQNELKDLTKAQQQSKIRDKRKLIFKEQFDFIRRIFNHIIDCSGQNPPKSLYNFSDYFDEFKYKFYINDNGVTKRKMIDYLIW